MTARSMFRGHPMHFDMASGEWRFDDDGAPVRQSWRDRPCGHCGALSTPEGHDACLGALPGVSNACCGHGVRSESYVQFTNGVTLRGFVVDDDDVIPPPRWLEQRELTPQT